MSIELTRADYNNPEHAKHLIELLDSYAQDAMGGGEKLTENTRKNLIPTLAEVPGAFSILCYVDGKPAGLANGFQGFSTFKCKPLLNIHDLSVNPEYRGQGISQKLLTEVENIALERGCCKVTLEVLSGNEVAKNAYLKFGYTSYELIPEKGQALFWEKAL